MKNVLRRDINIQLKTRSGVKFVRAMWGLEKPQYALSITGIFANWVDSMNSTI